MKNKFKRSITSEKLKNNKRKPIHAVQTNKFESIEKDAVGIKSRLNTFNFTKILYEEFKKPLIVDISTVITNLENINVYLHQKNKLGYFHLRDYNLIYNILKSYKEFEAFISLYNIQQNKIIELIQRMKINEVKPFNLLLRKGEKPKNLIFLLQGSVLINYKSAEITNKLLDNLGIIDDNDNLQTKLLNYAAKDNNLNLTKRFSYSLINNDNTVISSIQDIIDNEIKNQKFFCLREILLCLNIQYSAISGSEGCTFISLSREEFNEIAKPLIIEREKEIKEFIITQMDERNKEIVNKIFNHLEICYFETKMNLLNEGNKVNELFIILSGEVSVYSKRIKSSLLSYDKGIFGLLSDSEERLLCTYTAHTRCIGFKLNLCSLIESIKNDFLNCFSLFKKKAKSVIYDIIRKKRLFAFSKKNLEREKQKEEIGQIFTSLKQQNDKFIGEFNILPNKNIEASKFSIVRKSESTSKENKKNNYKAKISLLLRENEFSSNNKHKKVNSVFSHITVSASASNITKMQMKHSNLDVVECNKQLFELTTQRNKSRKFNISLISTGTNTIDLSNRKKIQFPLTTINGKIPVNTFNSGSFQIPLISKTKF